MTTTFLRASRATALALALAVAGCSNPADDKFQVTATDPKPVPEAAPAPTATATTAPAPAPEAKVEAAPTPAASATALAIAPEGSKIEFIGSKVTGSHNGGFKAFSGTAELAADKASLSKVTVEIDMNSTWADDAKLTGHLKSPDFFDVPKHPKATFVSTEIKPGGAKGATHTITGNLTLHGVTKSISIPATVTVKDGGLTLLSEFALSRKDFAITYAGMSNNLIRDEVVVKLDVKSPKKA